MTTLKIEDLDQGLENIDSSPITPKIQALISQIENSYKRGGVTLDKRSELYLKLLSKVNLMLSEYDTNKYLLNIIKSRIEALNNYRNK